MKNGFLLLLMVFFLVQILPAQDKSLEVQRLMTQAGVPGLALAYVKAGQPMETYHLGFRSADTRLPVDENTVFAAASLSKCVFAYGVMKLVEAGKLDLDKPLYEYLEYSDLAHDERYKKITARMTLSHTSGLPNWRNGPKLEFKYAPGERFQYSGEGFVFLMRAVEKITGQNMQDWMQQTVFGPLGMTRSSYIWKPEFESDYAIPHNQTGRTASKYLPEEGNSAHSLQTTAADYGRFIAALLTRKDLFTPQANSRLKPENDLLQWCLGVGFQQSSYGKAVWQWGDNGTFKAYFIAYPDKKEGLVYLTNGANGLNIAAGILSLFFPGDQPALKYLDYGAPDDPGLTLLKQALTLPFSEAVRPYLVEEQDLQDTTLLPAASMNRVGNQLLYRRIFDGARQAFELNLKAYPKSRPSMLGLAEVYLRQGRPDAALPWMSQALEADPTDATLKNMIDRLNGKFAPPEPGDQLITFRLQTYDNARWVTVAGSFNGWNDMVMPMLWEGGAWVARLHLKPGAYRYKFVVDGVWIPDPGNPEIDLKDHFNSVLKVE